MVPLVEILLLAGAGFGVCLCALGVYIRRQYEELGVTAYAGFLVTLGLGGLIVYVAAVVTISESATTEGLWRRLASFVYLFWGLSTVPWILFTLQYTGSIIDVRWETVVLLYIPFLGYGATVGIDYFHLDQLEVMQLLVGGLTNLYAIGLMFAGVALLLWTTYQYSHLSLRAGSILAIGPPTLFILPNLSRRLWEAPALAAGLFVLAHAVIALGAVFGVLWDGAFEVTPAVKTIGEREIIREMDNPVFVVDDCDHVIKCNEAATETLGTERSEMLGDPLGDVVGHDTGHLGTCETILLETADGRRRYDPQLSGLTDQHDRELGVLVTLHDVTDRELREQRLTVLNRVLRHNLRNKVEVLKGHAEVLDVNGQSDHLTTIVETADTIGDLGNSARQIDKFVSSGADSTETDIADAIEDQLETLGADNRDATVSLECPASAPVETNVRALHGALDGALDNALMYADSTVDITVTERNDGYTVSIADDGPGIPETEIVSITSGTETALQHGTGLGLWQLKWAVRTIGGNLEFETTGGTTVTFTVPAQ